MNYDNTNDAYASMGGYAYDLVPLDDSDFKSHLDKHQIGSVHNGFTVTAHVNGHVVLTNEFDSFGKQLSLFKVLVPPHSEASYGESEVFGHGMPAGAKNNHCSDFYGSVEEAAKAAFLFCKNKNGLKKKVFK